MSEFPDGQGIFDLVPTELPNTNEANFNQLKDLQCSKYKNDQNKCKEKGHCKADKSKCALNTESLKKLLRNIKNRWNSEIWDYSKEYIDNEAIDGYLIELVKAEIKKQALANADRSPDFYTNLLKLRASGALTDNHATALVYFFGEVIWKPEMIMDSRVIEISICDILRLDEPSAIAQRAKRNAKTLRDLFEAIDKDLPLRIAERKSASPIKNLAGSILAFGLILSSLTSGAAASNSFGDSMASNPLSAPNFAPASSSASAPSLAPPPRAQPLAHQFMSQPPTSSALMAQSPSSAPTHQPSPADETDSSFSLVVKSVKSSYNFTASILENIKSFYLNNFAQYFVTIWSAEPVDKVVDLRINALSHSTNKLKSILEQPSDSSAKDRIKEFARGEISNCLEKALERATNSEIVANPSEIINFCIIETLPTVPMAMLNDNPGNEPEKRKQLVINTMLQTTLGDPGYFSSTLWTEETGIQNGKEARELYLEELMKELRNRELTNIDEKSIGKIIEKFSLNFVDHRISRDQIESLAADLFQRTSANTNEDIETRRKLFWHLAQANARAEGLEWNQIDHWTKANLFDSAQTSLRKAYKSYTGQNLDTHNMPSVPNNMIDEQIKKAEEDSYRNSILLQAQKKELETQNRKQFETQRKIDTLESKKIKLDHQIEANDKLRQDFDKKDEEVQQLKQELKKTQKSLKKTEIGSMQNAIETLEQKLDNAQLQIADLNLQLKSIDATTDEANRREHSKINEELQKLLREFSNAKNAADSLNEQISDKKEVIAKNAIILKVFRRQQFGPLPDLNSPGISPSEEITYVADLYAFLFRTYKKLGSNQILYYSAPLAFGGFGLQQIVAKLSNRRKKRQELEKAYNLNPGKSVPTGATIMRYIHQDNQYLYGKLFYTYADRDVEALDLKKKYFECAIVDIPNSSSSKLKRQPHTPIDDKNLDANSHFEFIGDNYGITTSIQQIRDSTKEFEFKQRKRKILDSFVDFFNEVDKHKSTLNLKQKEQQEINQFKQNILHQ